MLQQPPGALRDEEQPDDHDARQNVDQAERDHVRLDARDGGGEVVDDGADERADARPPLEGREHDAAVAGRAAFLEVELREGHEDAVGEAEDEAPGVQAADAGGGHHDYVGADAGDAGDPDGRFAAHDGGDGAWIGSASEV